MLAGRLVEKVGKGEVRRLVENGKMVSSSFVTLQVEGKERKGRYVMKFKWQSKHWATGSVNVETVQSFAMDVDRGDATLSWDFKCGYRYFYLHPWMRDYFLVRYERIFTGASRFRLDGGGRGCGFEFSSAPRVLPPG